MEEHDAPLTVNPQAEKPGYLPGLVAINYQREHIIYQELPTHLPYYHSPCSQ
jgi:hypothetical protein